VILTPWKREASPVAPDATNDAVVARIDAWLPGLDAPLSWAPAARVAVAPSPVAPSAPADPRAGSAAEA
jgi:hypothetical protein